MKKIISIILSLSLIFSFIGSQYVVIAAPNENDDVLLSETNEDIAITIKDDNIQNYESISTDETVKPMVVGLIIRYVIVNGVKVAKHLYTAIKYAPKYPSGFKAVQNGTKNFTVNNKSLLEELRQIESGTWKKVYKDGYDKNGKKISIHYFQSKSGLVYDVKVKSGWSVK